MTDIEQLRLQLASAERAIDQWTTLALRYEEVLMLIAAPKRPDGTYNRSREACEQIAREVLRTR